MTIVAIRHEPVIKPFEKRLHASRHGFALEYLKNRDNTLTQIAILLGYSEVSAFNREFKCWTGSTPLDYRYRQCL